MCHSKQLRLKRLSRTQNGAPCRVFSPKVRQFASQSIFSADFFFFFHHPGLSKPDSSGPYDGFCRQALAPRRGPDVFFDDLAGNVDPARSRREALICRPGQFTT